MVTFFLDPSFRAREMPAYGLHAPNPRPERSFRARQMVTFVWTRRFVHAKCVYLWTPCAQFLASNLNGDVTLPLHRCFEIVRRLQFWCMFVASVLPGAPIYLTTTPYVYGQSADSLHVSASDLKSRPGGFLLLCAGCGIYICESFQYFQGHPFDPTVTSLLMCAGCGPPLC